ncbi:MAG: hypothetical protein WC378_01030 [Opitutaceae bacterium]|jgi:hypothetical protein
MKALIQRIIQLEIRLKDQQTMTDFMSREAGRLRRIARWRHARCARLSYRIAELSRSKTISTPPLDFPETSLLCDLTNEQLDHVSLGLEHAFGAFLSGNQGEMETFSLIFESGKLVAVHARTITVKDVWDVAQRMTA